MRNSYGAGHGRGVVTAVMDDSAVRRFFSALSVEV